MRRHRFTRNTVCRLCGLTALAVTVLIPFGALAQHANLEAHADPAQKAAIRRVEDDWVKALNTANVSVIDAILADDFVRPAPDSGNFVAKKELLAFYRSYLPAHTSNTRRIDDMTVSVYDTTAVARGTLTITNPEGQITSKLLFTDVFVKRNGKWQAVSAQENPAGNTDKH